MMRQTVDEKLNETVDQRLEASFSAVTTAIGTGDSKPKCHAELDKQLLMSWDG